ncbi:MAG: glycerophosphodiester phosphodiesterase family protein [Myxococcota bacterium]
MSHPFRLYGHRGAAAHHPENTLRSFRAAVEAGVDAIETDVRLSRDGEVVVFHDADGARTCGVPHRVRETPWAEVATWDAGEGEHPIRLVELLEAFPGVFVNVDLKDDDPEAAVRTLAVLARAGHAERIGLGSFHRRVVGELRRRGYHGQLALAPHEVAAARLLPAPLAARVVRGNAAQIPVSGGRIRLDAPGFIARCHRLGLRVDYWTIDDPAQARALVAAGADGIVTNDPAAVRAALEGP